ncbi:Fur family zinc uptake transcriptional regulator [Sphingomonas vulcanisoli]|uniref:Fur family zinc uptake transcriptional regulator n=1 Tax=Sphingomonas vulcanisoli TaxID=1658060 RepID=A0ABX0TPS9_9SPHN|nr:Fur family transcriptional regulator [Sphingomonas vulcanisoli]NIJ07543.1 Fur family zinc uptake transcriptional regulator [Sphingomonas vulcanisoli]
MAHIHALHDGDALDGAAERALIAAGEQWTPMRARVFEALRQSAKPASAYDIAELISKREDRRVPANSIYRILDLFVEANLAHRIESANAYVVNRHPACRHDCLFLICDQCGQVLHLDDDKATEVLRNGAIASGFLPRRPILEMRGLCADCGADATS